MPQRFRRRSDQAVTAVRLALESDTLVYRKWGHEQRARPGDWLVHDELIAPALVRCGLTRFCSAGAARPPEASRPLGAPRLSGPS